MPLSAQAQENKLQYTMQYNKSHYKRIPLDVTHDKYAEIKAAADAKNESVNGYIKSAIDARIASNT